MTGVRGGLVGQAPPARSNCTLLASWSESPERLWQAAGAEGHWLRLPMKEGWLAVALAGDRIEGHLADGRRRPDIGSICWPACSARRRSRWGPRQTLGQALAGRASWSAPACRYRRQRIVDAITRRQG